MMNNGNSNLRSWDEVQKEIFTAEEIAESALRVEIIGATDKSKIKKEAPILELLSVCRKSPAKAGLFPFFMV